MAIEIETAEDLYNIRNDLTADYIQVADIDLSGYSNWDAISPVERDGSFVRYDLAFTGTYDGQGHKITNLTQTSDEVWDENGYFYIHSSGLFGVLAGGGYIRNVTVENFILHHDTDGNSAVCAGVFGAKAKDFNFINCNIKNGLLEARSYIGGLISQIDDVPDVSFNHEMINCDVEGVEIRTYTGANDSGFLLGQFYGHGGGEHPLTVRDCNIKDCFMTNIRNDESGGFIGKTSMYEHTLTIENCTAENIGVSGGEEIGGVIGDVYKAGNFILNNVHITGLTLESIAGPWREEAGGLIGNCYITGQLNCENCSVTDSLIEAVGNGEQLEEGGGLFGNFTGQGYVKKSYTSVTLKGDYLLEVGGLFGICYSSLSSDIIIEECYSDSILETIGQFDDCGGFIGEVYGGIDYDIIIKNCYSVSDFVVLEPYAGWTGAENVTFNDTGGFIGDLDNTTFENCYCAGDIIIPASQTPVLVDTGGFSGYMGENCIFIKSYYDSNKTIFADNGGGEPRTSNEMTIPNANNTYETWDFDNIWGISSSLNSGYPVLRALTDIPNAIYIKFINTPEVIKKEITANRVIVKSSTASYTAQTDDLSQDNLIEKQMNIDEGDEGVCEQVAKALLEEWGRRKVSIRGQIKLNQGLIFEKKTYIIIPEGKIEGPHKVQKLEHNIDNYTTTCIVGDILLSDSELLARILNKIE